jgi:type III secretion protein SpaR/YscT/HrcT
MNPTDSYVNIFLALPQMAPITVLSVFFLTLARILPIMTVAPFLGAKNLPMIIRMMFSVALVAIFFPQNLLNVTTQITLGSVFIGLMIKELLIGICLGIFAAAPFFIAQMAGSLIDHSRGASSLQVNDPTTQTQASPIGLVYNYVLIAIFYTLGGPFLFFNGLADAYALIPVDRGLKADFFNMSAPFWAQAFGLGQHMVSLSIQIASPALIGVLLTDLFLGIANRLAPQVQIVFLGMPLKSWVGLALMSVAWTLIIQVMGKESISWMKTINQLIRQSALFTT